MWMQMGPPPLPREHGAWAMLLTPPLLALIALGPDRWGVLAILGWFAAYALRGPVEVLTGRGASGRAGMAQARPPVARFWLLLFGALALGFLVTVVWVRPILLLPLGLAGALLGVVYGFAARGESRALAAGLLAVAGLSAGGPLYYLAATGALPADGWVLLYGCLAYFGGSVFRVKTVARERRHAAFRAFSIALHLALVVGAAAAARMGWAPALLPAALIPPLLFACYGAYRGAAGPAVNLGQVGKVEIGLTLWFAFFLILGLRLS